LLHELIAKQKDITLINQEVMPDHVHLFVTAHPIFAPANIAKIGSSLFDVGERIPFDFNHE